MVVKRGNKGRRWVIVHAGSEEGWVGTPEVFEASSGSGDYHQNMNANKFEAYFRGLCAHLFHEREKRKVVFCMDNAKYHRREVGRQQGGKTLSAMNKSELIERLIANGCTEKKQKLAKLLRTKLYEMAKRREYQQELEVERIAALYGYSIFWLPPYHPQLNPIEEAWGLTKRHVAMENDGSNFQRVKALISEGFEKANAAWPKLVRRAVHQEKLLMAAKSIRPIHNLPQLVIELSDTDVDSSSDSDLDEEPFSDIDD